MGAFGLGFDYDTTRKEHRVRGVVRGSRAAAAGLGNGMRVLAHDIWFGGIHREVELVVRDGRTKKTIGWRPMSTKTVDVPQFTVR